MPYNHPRTCLRPTGRVGLEILTSGALMYVDQIDTRQAESAAVYTRAGIRTFLQLDEGMVSEEVTPLLVCAGAVVRGMEAASQPFCPFQF